MKIFCIFFLLLLLFGCGKTKNNAVTDDGNSENVSLNNEILVVDVKKEYPKGDPLYIQDIDDVEYIPMETTTDFLLENRNPEYIDDSLIIYRNFNDGNIFIFSREGNALKRINRKGQSGEEYTGVSNLVFDKINNELYVNDMWQKKIFVYDINGNYKRSFWHLKGTQYNRIYNQSEQVLLCYNVSFEGEDRYPFKIISKQNGDKIKDIEIPFEKRIDLKYRFIDENNVMQLISGHPAAPAIKVDGNNFILNEASSDTIYKLSEDLSLTPSMIQTPSVQSMGENPQYLAFVMNTRDYYFMFTQKKEFDKATQSGFPTIALVYDKKKKELFEQNFYNRDMPGKSFEFMEEVNDNQIVYRYQAYKLKDDLAKGELSGKLKEIAEKIEEEDNPVLMVITFKK